MEYVIIGGGAAGVEAAETLRLREPKSNITIVSQEGYAAYSRCLISRFLEGRLSENELYFKGKDFFKRYNVDIFLNTAVTGIDKDRQKVFTSHRKEINYDRLLIATGSRPCLPKIDGLNLKGVVPFYSLKDIYKIKELLSRVKNAVVVGAGFVGLEAAYALVKLGLGVKVIERCAQILPNQLDTTAAKIIQSDLENLGVEFILDESIISINGEDYVSSVQIGDKSYLRTDLVVMATGVLPNKEPAEEAGLETDRGVLVDEFLRTSGTNIFAAGDCIEIQDITFGRRLISATWLNAILQAKFAALNMLGERRRYTNAVGIQNAVQFHRIPAISFGKTFLELEENNNSYEVISIHEKNIYKKLILREGRVYGMIFVGDIAKAGFYAALIRHKVDVSKYKEKLLDEDFSYAYLKDEDFGEKSPYQRLPSCWKSHNWWLERPLCLGI